MTESKEWGEFSLAMATAYALQIKDSYMAIRWLDSYDERLLPKEDYLKFAYKFARFRTYSTNCGSILSDDGDVITYELVMTAAQEAQDAYDEYELATNTHAETNPFIQYGINVKTEISGIENQMMIFLQNNCDLATFKTYTEEVFHDSTRRTDSRIIALSCFIEAHLKANQLKEIEDIILDCDKRYPNFLEEPSRQSSWLCLSLAVAHKYLRNTDISNSLLEKLIMKSNLVEGFCNDFLKNALRCAWADKFNKDNQPSEFSEAKFAKFMYSKPYLRENIEECINLEPPDQEALYILGRYHELEGHYDEAIACYSKAKNMENAKAACALGYLYYMGRGVDEDWTRAEELWKFGRDRQHGGSCRYLYELYTKKKNEKKSLAYLHEAVNYGSKTAQRIFNELYNKAA